MKSNQSISVFGAYGHTGRFVVRELRRRGWTPILCGRDAAKLNELGAEHPDLELRVASVDDPASLDRALSGAAAIINCAGPFIDTAEPLVSAALRAGIHYFDVAAEQAAVLGLFERFTAAARDARIVVAPAMAFYGGLPDLLATAAIGDWAAVDEINIAVALNSWHPTRGTRLTGQRNPGKRLVFTDSRLERSDSLPTRTWNFPAPFGTQKVEGLSLTEAITISRHLQTREIRAYVSAVAMRDLHDPNTPPPTAADESGRSFQIFLVDVMVRKGTNERHAIARGRDIYAITAPIVAEAVERVLRGLAKTIGLATAGELFDANEFLRSLCPEYLSVEI